MLGHPCHEDSTPASGQCVTMTLLCVMTKDTRSAAPINRQALLVKIISHLQMYSLRYTLSALALVFVVVLLGGPTGSQANGAGQPPTEASHMEPTTSSSVKDKKITGPAGWNKKWGIHRF